MFAMTLLAEGQTGIRTHSANTTQQQPNHLAVLAKALNLSDAQVTSIRDTIKSQRPALKTMIQDVKAKRQSLKAAASAANPDPTAVGNAFLALRSSRANLKAGRQKLQASIRNVLTPDQQKSMDALRVVAQARYARLHRFSGGATQMGS
jgi:Spy/CpxP family protein refolding chaperone